MLKTIINKMLGAEKPDTKIKFKDISQNITCTKNEIEELRAKLQFVTDPILMNQLIYKLQSAETRYRYWYKLARELDCYDNITQNGK